LPTKRRILLSLMTEENDFQLEQAGLRVESPKACRWTYKFCSPENDTITQEHADLACIQGDGRVAARRDIFEPVGGTALPQVARAASSAGIGWCVLINVPEYLADLRRTARAPVFAVGTDKEEIGRIQAKQFAALLPRGGSVLYIQGPSEHFAAKQRPLACSRRCRRTFASAGCVPTGPEEGAARSVNFMAEADSSQ
jgi:ribose transport system substrate-binding protein